MFEPIPWPFFLIIAIVAVLVLLGIWERIVRIRARNWPVAQGNIDSTKVQERKGKRTRWYARLYYSFSVDGKRATGRYSQEFPYQDDAENWIRDLQGKPVLVHYWSRFPALSVIADDDLRRLLASRGPEPAVPAANLAPGSAPFSPRLTGWKRALGLVLMAVAPVGFIVSAAVHILAWLGRNFGFDQSWAVMHIVCFCTFVVTVLLVPKTHRRSESPEPRPWLVKLAVAVFIYGIGNFIFWMIVSITHHGLSPSQDLRFFSGHWMLFFIWQVVFLEPVVGR